jgi:hypothetical protein
MMFMLNLHYLTLYSFRFADFTDFGTIMKRQ